MTTTDLDIKLEILKVLERHQGRRNAIKASELAEMFGLSKTNTYAVRALITELIRKGYPICSATQRPEGYFLPETYQEVNDYCQTLKDRGIADIIRRRDVKLAAQRYFTGQPRLI